MCLGERYIREYSHSEKIIEIAGIVMMTVVALSLMTLFITVIIVKKKGL